VAVTPFWRQPTRGARGSRDTWRHATREADRSVASGGTRGVDQLACLEHYLRDAELVRGVRTAWAALSRACHHHPYELAPTAPELAHWLDAVDGLIGRLAEADLVV
jgi:hypothetical protein